MSELPQKKRLVLVDGHAMLYRAFFAFPQSLTTRRGELINAVYGFTSILLNAINDLSPDYMAVSFDVGETWRHQAYPEYKAHREKMPDELREQEDRVYEVLEALNVPVHTKEGFEADDVIGTIAWDSTRDNSDLEALIVTGDMDMLQLVRDADRVTGPVEVYMPGRGMKPTLTFNEAKVLEEYGLTPKQVIDYKALAGDSSDNIPGVRGVGPKTAVKLIERYGDLRGIYKALESEHIDETLLRGALLEKVKSGKEAAFESQRLVTITTNVPLTFSLDDCQVQAYEKQKAVSLFEEMEFRSLINKLPKDAWEMAVQEALF
jgi:DNA polymerase I